MPSFPFLHQFIAVYRNPCYYFITQAAWPVAHRFQRGQVDADVEPAADQMYMRRAMITFAHFEFEFVVAKALLRCHERMV